MKRSRFVDTFHMLCFADPARLTWWMVALKWVMYGVLTVWMFFHMLGVRCRRLVQRRV